MTSSPTAATPEYRHSAAAAQPYPVDDPPEFTHDHILKVGQLTDGRPAGWHLNGMGSAHGMITSTAAASGGSSAMRVAALSALRQGLPVDIVDSSHFDFAELADWPGVGTIASTTDDITALIEQVRREMKERHRSLMEGTSTHAQLRPRLLMLDDWHIVRSILGGRSERAIHRHPTIELVNELVVIGKAARVHVLFGGKQLDQLLRNVLPNLGFRLELTGSAAESRRALLGRRSAADLARTPGQGLISTPYGPAPAQVYWLPELDLAVPDTQLAPADAELRRQLHDQVVAAQQQTS